MFSIAALISSFLGIGIYDKESVTSIRLVWLWLSRISSVIDSISPKNLGHSV